MKALSWIGVVRDLRTPPAEVLAGDRSLPRPIVERVAQQLAANFKLERLSQQSRNYLAGELASFERGLENLRDRGAEARDHFAAMLDDVQLPELPSLETLTEQARRTLAHTPSLDEIVARAREILLESLLDEWQPQGLEAPA